MAHLQDPRFCPNPLYPHDYEVGMQESMADKISLVKQFKTAYPAIPQHNIVQLVASRFDAGTSFAVTVNQLDKQDKFVRRIAQLKVSFKEENDEFYKVEHVAILP